MTWVLCEQVSEEDARSEGSVRASVEVKPLNLLTLGHPPDRPPSPVNVTVTHLRANSATVSWDVPEGNIVIGYSISQQV